MLHLRFVAPLVATLLTVASFVLLTAACTDAAGASPHVKHQKTPNQKTLAQSNDQVR